MFLSTPVRCMRRLGVLAAVLCAQTACAGETEDRVLDAVNRARQAAGCPALVVSDALTSVAYSHAKAMAEQDFFSHTGKNGSKISNRIKATGYRYSTAAENIGMGYASVAEAMQGWMTSSGHRDNILNCKLTETGIAMYYQADDKPLPGRNFAAKYYWVEVFARPK